MQSRLGQNQERMRPASETAAQNGRALTTKEIPYDYVATFTLEGRPGNRVQDVINISIDGAFVAVSIGYSFVPPQFPDLTDRAVEQQANQILRSLGNDPVNQLSNSIPARLTNTNVSVNQALALAQILVDPRELLQCFLMRLCGIHFKYTIVDSATGRELQNQPIHNIAGLGEPTGDRPFRPLAKPMLFQPRSTIRIEIEEISRGVLYGFDSPSGQRIGGELFIVLHGYKILGYGTGGQ